MRRYTLGESFDEKPLPDLDSEAIDFRVASEFFAPVRKLARREVGTGPRDPQRRYYLTRTP